MKSKPSQMPYRTFISIVTVVQHDHGVSDVEEFLNTVGGLLEETFSDYEIVIVGNRSEVDFESLKPNPEIANNCFIVELASEVVWDRAAVAGLERANGDYSILFDISLANQAQLITQMYELAQQGSDIIYLRNSQRRIPSPRREIFYRLLQFAGERTLQSSIMREFLVSRRALNWILRSTSGALFLGEKILNSGYRSSPIDVSVPVKTRRRAKSTERRLAWSILSRLTSLPLAIGKFSVLAMLCLSGISIVNALLVRTMGYNIFGIEEVYVPGWAFMVILLSSGMVLISIAIYAVLRLLYVIHDEMQDKSDYTVERFGRL